MRLRRPNSTGIPFFSQNRKNFRNILIFPRYVTSEAIIELPVSVAVRKHLEIKTCLFLYSFHLDDSNGYSGRFSILKYPANRQGNLILP